MRSASVPLGKKFDDPLFHGRADEAVERAVVAHAAGVDDLAQAAEDAGFGVGEGSVKVEDEGGKNERHASSFAERVEAANRNSAGRRNAGMRAVFACGCGEKSIRRRLDFEGRVGCVVEEDGDGATGEAGFSRVGAAGEDGGDARAEDDAG